MQENLGEEMFFFIISDIQNYCDDDENNQKPDNHITNPNIAKNRSQKAKSSVFFPLLFA